MRTKVETHTHLPESAGYVIAIVVGLLLLLFAWFMGPSLIGLGWSILVGIVGFGLIVVGFLKLLFG
jgi:small-conductance mechanosensitive channel